MGNCATNCNTCMGKDGDQTEFNMDSQAMALQRFGGDGKQNELSSMGTRNFG